LPIGNLSRIADRVVNSIVAATASKPLLQRENRTVLQECRQSRDNHDRYKANLLNIAHAPVKHEYSNDGNKYRIVLFFGLPKAAPLRPAGARIKNALPAYANVRHS